ncbi:hypothetical protein [Amycolatopsis nigrescens]|uniref:hypothetical protein n=1 Tax=Amycolatopsis nigrescens TaxID=381445 RepID=UPI000374285F|nr:hypothetical protein [Amycolatopsis nigrescens]
MTGTGFNVDVKALQSYVKNIGDYQKQAGKISDLVGQADVGDESWGVVGLFTKGKYTEALGQFTALLHNMQEGLKSAAEKFGAGSSAYHEYEDEVRKLLEGVLKALDETAPPPATAGQA